MEYKNKDFRIVFAKCLLNESKNLEKDIEELINIMSSDFNLFKDDNIKEIFKKFFTGYIKCYIYNKENNIDQYFKNINSEKFSLAFLYSLSNNRNYPDSRLLLKEYLFLINYNKDNKYNIIHDQLLDYLDTILF